MIFRFERFELDTDKRELRHDAEPRAVEPQVYELLKFLIENRARLVSRDEIFKAVWGGRIVSDGVLATRMNAVRRAIGDDGKGQRFVRTYRRSGVRFVGAVEERSQSSFHALPSRSAARIALKGVGVPSIRVDGIAIGAGGKDLRACTDAVLDEVRFALHAVDWLRVCSQIRTLVPTGGPSAAWTCDYVLDGNIRESDGAAVLLICLHDTVSGVCIWRERYRFVPPLAGARFAELAGTICKAVAETVFAVERMRARASKVGRRNAWHTLVLAVGLINTRKKERVAFAASMLRRLIDAGTQSAAPFSLLAFCEALSVHFGWKSCQDGAHLIQNLLEEAFARDDHDAWTHLSLGYARLQIDKRPDEAIESFRQALKFDPNLSMAHYLTSLCYVYLGEPAHAFTHASHAEQLGQFDLLARGNAGVIDNVRASACFVADRFEDGIAYARKSIAQSPFQVPAYRQLILNGVYRGEIRLAENALKKVSAMAPDIPRWLTELEPVWAREKDYKRYLSAFGQAGKRIQ